MGIHQGRIAKHAVKEMQHRLRQRTLLPSTGGHPHPRNGPEIASVSSSRANRPEHTRSQSHTNSWAFLRVFPPLNCVSSSPILQDATLHQHGHRVPPQVLHVPFLHKVPPESHRLLRPLPSSQGGGAAPEAGARHPGRSHAHLPQPASAGHQLGGESPSHPSTC